jgi:hypothetical protein
VKVDRLDVLQELLPAIDKAMNLSDEELCRRFQDRDVLTGTVATLLHACRTITGRVMRVDPMHGLVVQTDQGEQRLPAATTSTHPPA